MTNTDQDPILDALLDYVERYGFTKKAREIFQQDLKNTTGVQEQRSAKDDAG